MVSFFMKHVFFSHMKQNVCLWSQGINVVKNTKGDKVPKDYFFLDGFFLRACICQSHEINVCLGTTFLEWFLFVSVYLSVTQNKWWPRDYFFGMVSFCLCLYNCN